MLQVYEENITEQDKAEKVQPNIAATTYHTMRDEEDAILATGILPANMSNAQLNPSPQDQR